VKDIKRYEKELLEYIDVNDKSIFDDIRVSKVLNDDTVEKIKNIVNEFHSKFKKSE
jgi:F-type H+-transporting ATPase subunit alpha